MEKDGPMEGGRNQPEAEEHNHETRSKKHQIGQEGANEEMEDEVTDLMISQV